MTPSRVSPGGSFRVDRRFPEVGRIALATGTRNRKIFHAIDRMLTELHEDGYIEVLRAIKDRRLTLLEVYDAHRAKRVTHLPAALILHRSLWTAVEEWLPRSARAESSRKRYEVSLNALRERSNLPEDARVEDLRGIDWRALEASWPNSGADWNRLRAAVSTFLTHCFDGDKHHPFRRELMRRIPRGKEPPPRVPDLNPERFWELVDHAAEHIRPCLVALAGTGLRVRSEYLALEEHHLMPLTKQIKVPGTKTEGSAGVIPVAPELWPWIVKAVPSPLRYKALRLQFKKAAKRIGMPDLRLHDLRHLYGQTLSEAGLPEAKIQAALRHQTPAMTRRYTQQRDKGDAARAMGAALRRQDGGA